MQQTASLSELYDAMLDLSGYQEALENKNDMESRSRLENIMELKSNIVEYESKAEDPSLAGFLEEMALYTDADQDEEEDDTVLMMTMHSAKGLEFPTVFLCGMEDGLFPSFRADESDEDLEEERRLCYVAITRAKQHTRKYDISPQYITLEILESLVLEQMDQVNDCIAQLRASGFRISMDDFGSGYSSLNTLGRLKIDELKLDRLFLMGVAKDTDGTQRKIMACILELAKQLNISTVAEGVETQENEQMMAQLSCNYGQGYYYSRPLTTVDFEREFLAPYSKHMAGAISK